MSSPIRKAYFNNRRSHIDIVKNNHDSAASTSLSPYYTAKQLATIYGFPAPNTSISSVIGVMSFGGGLYGNIDQNGVLTNGDVQKYWAYEGIAENQMPRVLVCFEGGTKNDLTDIGSTGENTLDVSVIGSCCPNPNLTIILFVFPQSYTLTQSFQVIINGITVAGIKYIPSIISVSWGAPEILYLTNGVDRYGELEGVNNLLKTATQNGLNVCVASGDNGSTDNNGTTQLSADFPSSCPYVTAVGGTTLVCPNGVYDSETTETVWNDGMIRGTLWATGGGISTYFTKPVYQISTLETTETIYRSVPDIALNADPDTGIVMYQNGILQKGIGGTSMGAPMFAAYLAAINVKTFVNPLLYNAANKLCFNDITIGSNYDTNDRTNIKSYTAGVGYDYCSGLGSIIGKKLTSVLAPIVPVVPVEPIAPVEPIVPVVPVEPVVPVVPVEPIVPVALINSISISTTLNLNTSKTFQFTSVILPANTENQSVVWTSNNTAIATVNSRTGLVTAIKVGSVKITVTTTDGSNKSASMTLTIISPPILTRDISLSPSSITLNLVNNKTFIFTPRILPSNTTNKTINWLSSNTRVVNVNLETGLIRAVGTGTAYIGAFIMDGSGKYTVSKVNVLATPTKNTTKITNMKLF